MNWIQYSKIMNRSDIISYKINQLKEVVIMCLPQGALYINEVKAENSISFTDNPSADEIQDSFKMWKNAKTILYVVNKQIKKEYLRKDYI